MNSQTARIIYWATSFLLVLLSGNSLSMEKDKIDREHGNMRDNVEYGMDRDGNEYIVDRDPPIKDHGVSESVEGGGIDKCKVINCDPKDLGPLDPDKEEKE